MRARQFKDAVFDQFSRVARAFSSPKRLELIDLLCQGERPVEALARETGLTVANTSRHLQILKAAQVVVARKEGVQVYYRLSDPLVLEGYRTLQRIAEARLAEIGRLVDDYFGNADGLEPVESAELLRRARNRDVVVIDVRPPEEYAAGHIAGALSIPLIQLEQRLADLPKDKRIVAYCRGPYCVLAAKAVRRLRARAYQADRLKEGYPEWRDAGFPIQVGPQSSHRAKRS